MREAQRLFAVLAMIVVVAAGCGGSTKPSAGTTSTTSRLDTAGRADQALAARAVLTLSDFPPGWTSKPHTDTKSPKADKQFRGCLHLPSKRLISDAVNADSSDFTSPSNQQITNSVGVAKTAIEVTHVLDVISGPSIPDCLARALDTFVTEQSLKSALPNGATIGKASVNPESFNALGSRTVAYRISLPITAAGVNVGVYVDLVVVQQGRVGILLTAEDTIAPFPTDTSASLIRKVLARIGAAS